MVIANDIPNLHAMVIVNDTPIRLATLTRSDCARTAVAPKVHVRW